MAFGFLGRIGHVYKHEAEEGGVSRQEATAPSGFCDGKGDVLW